MTSCTCSGDMLAATFESGLLAGAAAPFGGAAFAGAAAGFSAGADWPSSDLQPVSSVPQPNASPVTTTLVASAFVNRITISPPPGVFRSWYGAAPTAPTAGAAYLIGAAAGKPRGLAISSRICLRAEH